jgi:hypothetical protein
MARSGAKTICRRTSSCAGLGGTATHCRQHELEVTSGRTWRHYDEDMSSLSDFLMEPRHIVVAGVKRDGRPHLSINIFLWDGERFFNPSPGEVQDL